MPGLGFDHALGTHTPTLGLQRWPTSMRGENRELLTVGCSGAMATLALELAHAAVACATDIECHWEGILTFSMSFSTELIFSNNTSETATRGKNFHYSTESQSVGATHSRTRPLHNSQGKVNVKALVRKRQHVSLCGSFSASLVP